MQQHSNDPLLPSNSEAQSRRGSVRRILESIEYLLGEYRGPKHPALNLLILAENLETMVDTYNVGRRTLEESIEILIEDISEAIG